MRDLPTQADVVKVKENPNYSPQVQITESLDELSISSNQNDSFLDSVVSLSVGGETLFKSEYVDDSDLYQLL
jgi:hypothetical protein